MTAETALMQDLETERFALRQTEASHFELLYQVASDPAVWAQHPESNRWQRPVFTAFFEGGLRNDLGCFTIFDRSRQAVIGSTRFYGYDAAESAVRDSSMARSKEGRRSRVGLRISWPRR